MPLGPVGIADPGADGQVGEPPDRGQRVERLEHLGLGELGSLDGEDPVVSQDEQDVEVGGVLDEEGLVEGQGRSAIDATDDRRVPTSDSPSTVAPSADQRIGPSTRWRPSCSNTRAASISTETETAVGLGDQQGEHPQVGELLPGLPGVSGPPSRSPIESSG